MGCLEDNMSSEFKFSNSLHPSSVLYSFSEFQSANVFCDVTLLVNDEEIRAHKVVLAAASPFFRSMFISGMKEAKEDKISLSDIESDILKSIITYIYSSEITVSEDNVYALVEAADFLQLVDLLRVCQHYLLATLGPANCLSVCTRARLRQAHELARHAFHHTLDHFDQVVQQEEFLHAPPDLLLDVLSARAVCASEHQLLQSVVRWVHHDEPGRAQYLEPLLGKLHLQQLPMAKLVNYKAAPPVLSGSVGDVLQAALEDAIAGIQAMRCDGELVPSQLTTRRLLKRRRHISEQEVILAIGGDSAETTLGSVESFTASFDSWHIIMPMVIYESGALADSVVIPAMAHPRAHAAVASVDNYAYVAGGFGDGQLLKSVECFNADSCTWTELADLPVGLQGAGAAFLDGCLHVVGGHSPGGLLNSVWRLVEAHGEGRKWREVVPMTTHRACHGVVCVTGVLYAVGGLGGSTADEKKVLRSVERYSPLLGRWQPVAPMHYARSKFGCIAVDDYIYVMGGLGNKYWLKSVERYNTLTNEWSILEPMNFPRSDFGIAVCSQRIYCIGGMDGIHLLNTVDKYNPNTNRWHCVSPLEIQRVGVVATTIRVPIIKDRPI